MGITFNSSTVYIGSTSQGSTIKQSNEHYYYIGINGSSKYTTNLTLTNSHYIKTLTFNFKKSYASSSSTAFKISVCNSSGTELGSTTFTSSSTGSTSVSPASPTITFSNYIAPQTLTVKFTMTSSSGLITIKAVQASATPMTFSSGTDYTLVSYNSNGGTVSPTSYYIAQGGKYSLPTSASKTGHTLNGYYTASSGGTKITTSTTVTTAAKITLYAQWTGNQYTLVVNPNGGSYNGSTSATTMPVKLQYGTGNYWSIGAATRAGYTLQGYFTSASGGTKVYNADGTCIKGTAYFNTSGNGQYCYTGNLTVYAQWSASGGYVNIHNGTKWESYQCYIHNGTDWELYSPYVHNGTSWDICG